MRKRSILVVDLLKRFIAVQPTLGGPFDTPENFVRAMRLFVKDRQAIRHVSEIWEGKAIDEALASGPRIPHEEAFARVRKLIDQSIATDIKQMLQHLDNDVDALESIYQTLLVIRKPIHGIWRDGFVACRFMHRLVEHAIIRVHDAVECLSAEERKLFRSRDLDFLKRLCLRVQVLGRPVRPVVLWDAYQGLLDRMYHRVVTGRPRRS